MRAARTPGPGGGGKGAARPGQGRRGAAYAGLRGPRAARDRPSPGTAGGTTLAPARPAPDLDDGDHDRMAHIVLEGYTPKDGRVRVHGPERGRGHRQPDAGAGPVRQGVGARARPGPLRPVPHLQGDRRVHGVEDPGQLSRPAVVPVPGSPARARYRAPDRIDRGRARPPEGSTLAQVSFDGVTKRFGDTTAVDDLTLRVADGELLVLLGSSGCGKTTALRLVAGLEEVTERHRLHRRAHRQRRRPQGPRRGHGLPELRALPAPDRGQEHRVPAPPARRGQGGAGGQGASRRPRPSGSAPCSTASPPSSRAASASGSPWPGPSCASRWSSSWTSRCRTSTPRCGCRPGPTSWSCRRACRPPRSTSPTTRSRP